MLTIAEGTVIRIQSSIVVCLLALAVSTAMFTTQRELAACHTTMVSDMMGHETGGAAAPELLAFRYARNAPPVRRPALPSYTEHPLPALTLLSR